MADNNLVMEQRKESMVSLSNPRQQSILRTAHFLTPSIKAPVEAPPPCSLTNATKNYKDLPFEVDFRGWRHSTKKWESWVDQMRSFHHLTWKKAGIFDAIMSSTSIIHRNNSLVYGFVEKWCPVCNSFVFPWGEATVTLEDMIVLGGYSVLGDSVLITPEKSEMKDTVKKLQMECSEMKKTKSKKADQGAWMNKFMDSGSAIEHEAFLAFWLCRFVFPMRIIGESVLSIAVHLSRGIKIALAPAVLAGIYQSLALLRAAVTAARKIGNGCECDSVLEVTVSAPLALVQVWIWERFPTLRPKPNSIRPSEPRIARWHNLRKVDIDDLSRRIDSATKNFEWCPYLKDMGSSFHRKIYADDEHWVLVETLDEELEGLIRCLRVSELVNLEANCIEQYLPHRVSLQFGMDQDLPGYVARENVSPEIAWSNYNRPIRDKKVYVPPHEFEPGVTTRYLKWWNEVNYGWSGMNEGGEDDKSCSVETDGNETKAGLHKKRSFRSLEVKYIQSDSYAGVSPDFSPNRKRARKRAAAGPSGSSGISKLWKHGRNAKFVPRKVALQNSSSTPNGTKSGVHKKYSFKSSKTIFVEQSTRESYGSRESNDDDIQVRVRSSSTEDNGNFQEVTPLPKPAEFKVKKTLEKEGKEQWIDAGLRLEERITIIEKLCDLLKNRKIELH